MINLLVKQKLFWVYIYEFLVFENDIHAHVGYELEPETGKWRNICKPYYCDIENYFDKYQKWIKDICTESEERKKKDDDNTQYLMIFLFVVVVSVACGIIIVIIIGFIMK